MTHPLASATLRNPDRHTTADPPRQTLRRIPPQTPPQTLRRIQPPFRRPSGLFGFMMHSSSHLVATLLLAVAVAGASGARKPAVTTSQGRIIGTTAAVNVERFAGIPFAEPPTGRLRFARAVQGTKSFPKGVLDASLPGAPCIQVLAPGAARSMALQCMSPWWRTVLVWTLAVRGNLQHAGGACGQWSVKLRTFLLALAESARRSPAPGRFGGPAAE